MNKIMEKLNKLSPPVAILIASIILGGFYFASQIIKQQSIERQLQIKINQEKTERYFQNLQEGEEKNSLFRCLSSAEDNYNKKWKSQCIEQASNSCKFIAIRYLANNVAEGGDATPKQEAEAERIKQECINQKAPNCSLSIETAENLDNFLKNEKDECHKLYR